MKTICNNNEDCNRCSNMGACNAIKYQDLINEFFRLYGSCSTQEANKTIHIWHPHPETIHKSSEIAERMKRAEEDINRLENYILQLKAYEIALTERYNYLETVPKKQKIKLQRYKKYRGNVFYHIIFYEVNLDTNEEIEIKRTTYKGTERKQALIDFESLKTEYKSAIFVKDIEKSKYE